MIESPGNNPKLTVQALRGLNERSRFSNLQSGEFDYLRNCIPTILNTLSKVNGCRLYDTFTATSPILGIVQTFDSQKNIIVQTRDGVYVISEYDLFGIVRPTPVLTPYTQPTFGEIIAITATNPAAIQTGVAHNLTTGDWVTHSGFTDGTFSVPINGTFQVTVVDSTHYTVVSDCTVAPTDYAATIFTETVAPDYNGDDELYPEALIRSDFMTAVGSITSWDYYWSNAAGFIYQFNPDGTVASFLSITSGSTNSINLTPGKYRIEGFARIAGTAATNARVYLTASSGTLTNADPGEAQALAIASENVTLNFSAVLNTALPCILKLFGNTSVGTTFPYGAPMTGFTAPSAKMKVTKTA